MSNDPKDAVVDLSKLLGGQSSISIKEPTIPKINSPSMITSCNKGAGLIGHENFAYNDVEEVKKPD